MKNEECGMQNKAKITNFTDLIAWQEGHQLVLSTYKVVKKFPKKEDYGLSSQMCRAAVSITSNIAEGFTRDTYGDKCHFYVMSHASLTELQNQLLVAKDVGYISDDEYLHVAERTNIVFRLLSGLIRSTKEKK